MSDPAALHPSIDRRAVDVDGLRLSFLEAGEGEPVLFLHGWPTSALLWREILPAVAAVGRRAIALDLPGFGDSAKPAASYSFPFFERVIDGFLQAIGVARTGLVVHDLGGPVGLYWAARHPDRVRELALCNTLVFPDVSWMVKLFVVATRLPLVRAWLSSGAGIAWSMRFGVADPARITPQVAELYRAPFRDRAARRALLAAGHGLHPGGFATLVAGLEAWEGPLHLVWGERDRILPEVGRTMERVRALHPRAGVTQLEDAGHFLQEDAPRAVAAALAGFLGRGAGGSDGLGS